MIRKWRWCFVVVLWGAAFGLVAQEEGRPVGWERYVEPALAAGGVGWVAFPAVFEGFEPVEVLDPHGYTLHMTSADDPGDEWVVDAGRPAVPPVGRQRIWMQGPWAMSDHARLVAFIARPRKGLAAQLLPLAPAGGVSLPEELVLPELELWVLDAGTHPEGLDYELSRRRPAAEAAEGVLMPAGRALAGLWDRRAESWVALTPPFAVVPRRIVPAPLQRPAEDAAQLFAYVAEPHGLRAGDHDDLDLAVRHDGARFEPDFTFATAWGLYAVWYRLPPGPAVIDGGNGHLYLERQPLELPGGEITGFEAHLTRRPLLDVQLVLPSEVREEPFTLRVHRLPDRELLAEVVPPRRAGHHRFTELEQTVVEVTLDTRFGPFRRQVDLTGVQEDSLVLEPELIEITGTVRRGGEPHPARLDFATVAHDTLTAETDEEDAYRLTGLQPLRVVNVHLAQVEQAPWSDFFDPPLDESRELDFDVPDAEVTVRVVDAATGAGIAGARVQASLDYFRPDDPDREGDLLAAGAPDGSQRALVVAYETDDEGVAHLPPPRRGRLQVNARAEGYPPPDADAAVVVEIDDPSLDRELEIALEPYDDLVPVRVLLPDGRPAAGARVALLDDPAAPGFLFSGATDAAGRVEVPREPEQAFLLVLPTDPGTAFALVDRGSRADPQDVVLPRAADLPLVVRSVDSVGEPVGEARVALWLGRQLLGPSLLAVLSGGSAHTDPNGYLALRSLPRRDVAVLAWRTGGGSRVDPAGLEHLATPVPHPWPAIVELPVIP